MKFLFRSGWGESLGIARRVEQEGNLVRFSILEKCAQHVGDGLIQKARWPDSIGWADVVVFDSNHGTMPQEAERLRGKKPFLGSGLLAGQMEHDRGAAGALAASVGLEIGHFERFAGAGAWREARRFLADVPDGTEWVWKNNGDSEVASTFVESIGYPEMERMLNYLEYLHQRDKEKPDFILCEKITGKEISTEAWFNGKEWFLANNTIEKNRFFPGDLGEKTGCAGNVVWTYPTPGDSKLWRALLEPLTEHLQGKYNGPLDVNALIEDDSNEPLFLEFTPRFGYDAIFALGELVGGDLGRLFWACANGEGFDLDRSGGGFGGGLRVHAPPYPEEESERAAEIPIFGVDAEGCESKGIWLAECKLDKEGELVTSGPNGYVLVLTAKASGVEEVMKKCSPDTFGIKIPLMRYREDLPEVLEECYSDLVDTEWIGPTRRGLFGRRPPAA